MFKESRVSDFDIIHDSSHIELMINEYNTLYKIHNIYEHIDNVINNFNTKKYISQTDYSIFVSKIFILLNMYIDLKIPISNLVEHQSKFLNDPTILSLMREGD